MIIQSPLTGSLTNSLHHTMVLCGYQTIKAGDVLTYLVLGKLYEKIIKDTDTLYIGKTYWIFKNSYGTSSNYGYMYLMIRNFNDFDFGDICRAVPPVTSLHYTSDDIRCVDLDGDGYFNWGIGPKPAFPVCPLCCPDEEDGDDSNPYLGPMDEYGNCRQISSPYAFPEYPITSTVTWQDTHPQCGNVIVKNGGNLTLNGSTINLEGNGEFSVELGGTLTFNSGTIQ